MRLGAVPLVRGIHAAALAIRRPPPVPPGHFYSPATSREDIERATRSRRAPVGIDLRHQDQLTLLRAFDLVAPPVGRWKPGNEWFESADAAMLCALLLYLSPRRVI